MDELELTHEERGDTLVIHLAGPMQVDQVMRLAEAFQKARKRTPRRLILDLRGLSRLDAVGFAFLSASQVHFLGLGILVTLVGLSREIAARLELDATERARLEQWTASAAVLDEWSTTGGGATNGKTHPHPAPAPASATGAGKSMILLVDDEPSLLRIMTIYLQRKGFHVAGAETVAKAAALMREHAHKIELALVDYSLGPQTGLDAIAALSCLKPRLKVILMSGMNVDPDEIRRYPNIVRSIRKPFRMDGLVAMVREMLSLPEFPEL